MNGLYKMNGMMSIGIADDIIITEALVNSLRYIFKVMFQPRGNITVVIPQQIVFWSKSLIPDKFKQLMTTVAQYLHVQYGITYKGFGFVEFNEVEPYFMDNLEKFLNDSNGGRMFLLKNFEGILSEIRSTYEEFFRTITDDVTFIGFNDKGEMNASYIHTPFIVKEILF